MAKNDYRTGAEMLRDLNSHLTMLRHLEGEVQAEKDRKKAKALASLSADQKNAIAARVAARHERVQKMGRLSS